jgi:hypothetical protein
MVPTKRCRIENAPARLKDRRGIATRHTRCSDPFRPPTHSPPSPSGCDGGSCS